MIDHVDNAACESCLTLVVKCAVYTLLSGMRLPTSIIVYKYHEAEV